MNQPAVSVVVVSHGRPDELHRCLAGLCQLDYPNFEIIVVADAASRRGLGVSQRRIKLVYFEVANISAARNAGIAQAAGEVVAFIDDDAVPEPTWLTHLTGPFTDPNVGISGGFVIGRNGISLQWAARHILPDGTAEPLDDWGSEPKVFDPKDGITAKTEGTNMAVRRVLLEQVGGFDEAFEFYLDETDLNMRLAAIGAATALVPFALVHHGFAQSARRTARRVPRDLTQIAASTAVFQRKHAGEPDKVPARAAQRQRVVRHMVQGDLMPGDVRRLLRGFDAGWADGLARDVDQQSSYETASDFKPITVHQDGHIVQSTRFWRASKAGERAANTVADGTRVTLFVFSLSPLKHRAWFDPRGFWVHWGGQFGPSDRSDPIFKLWRAKSRIAREIARLSQVRPFGGR